MVPGQQEVRIGAADRIRSVPFAGLVLLGVSASGFAAPLPPFLRFLLAVSVFVWIPGAVVVRGLLRVRTESAFVQYPLDFFAGASIASLIAWPFVWFDASLGACSATLQWLLGALFAAAWLLSQADLSGL